jgi:hypothetical protein
LRLRGRPRRLVEPLAEHDLDPFHPLHDHLTGVARRPDRRSPCCPTRRPHKTPPDVTTVHPTASAAPSGRLEGIFQGLIRSTTKFSHYFAIYEHLFGRYVGTPVTFLEVGVLNGGSLLMWKEYFGPTARIIGVDLNPAAKAMEAEGFEIFIGDQADPRFWRRLFEQVGRVDVLLDDGGHTNEQQIVTVVEAMPHIRDGGVLVVEDVVTSYLRPEYGNPSRYSFIEFAKCAVDIVNGRASGLSIKPRDPCGVGASVYSMEFFESVVAFHVDRRLAVASRAVNAGEMTFTNADFRHESGRMAEAWRGLLGLYHALPSAVRIAARPLRDAAIGVRGSAIQTRIRIRNRRLKRYFD